jgi:hypothetical protein
MACFSSSACATAGSCGQAVATHHHITQSTPTESQRADEQPGLCNAISPLSACSRQRWNLCCMIRPTANLAAHTNTGLPKTHASRPKPTRCAPRSPHLCPPSAEPARFTLSVLPNDAGAYCCTNGSSSAAPCSLSAPAAVLSSPRLRSSMRLWPPVLSPAAPCQGAAVCMTYR